MPNSLLALALIKTAGVPLAAPSANASGRPSPTTARHVKSDLEGKINWILDGGACDVGVESTVVDGLCTPPVVLRPGGVGIEEVRSIRGWEGCVVGYSDGKDEGGGETDGDGVTKTTGPRAPGMKYRHYSPKARVVLVEPGVAEEAVWRRMQDETEAGVRCVGVLQTRTWKHKPPYPWLASTEAGQVPCSEITNTDPDLVPAWIMFIGPTTAGIAQNLFSALREMDAQGVKVIFVEGIADEGEASAAVMNRLRKAAGEVIKDLDIKHHNS